MEPENKIDYFEMAKASETPIETDEDFYWYVIEVLPPIYANGWVGLGEPYSHTSDDRIITYWVRKQNEKYFCFFGTQQQAEAVKRNSL